MLLEKGSPTATQHLPLPLFAGLKSMLLEKWSPTATQHLPLPLFAGLKSMLLEKKVEALSGALEMREAQLGEVLAAAQIDPATLQQVGRDEAGGGGEGAGGGAAQIDPASGMKPAACTTRPLCWLPPPPAD
jgi:hypothetical protein